jgi:uncharacterized phage-associated protein
MYDARAIANFFLDRAGAGGVGLTLLTLLKILFFAHAWHLAKTDRPLIAQPFEAWQYGPVSRVVYDQFKRSGDQPLQKKAVSFDPKQMSFITTPYSFDEETTLFLEHVFDYYCKYHPYRLVDLTHEVDGPWHKVWMEAEKRAVPGMVIPNQLIRTWFRLKGGLDSTTHQRRRLS